jgi:hypothetical protein
MGKGMMILVQRSWKLHRSNPQVKGWLTADLQKACNRPSFSLFNGWYDGPLREERYRWYDHP